MNDGMNKQAQVFINPASSEKHVDMANTEEKRIGSMASEIMSAYMPTYAPIPRALVSDEEFYEVFSEIRLP